MSNAIWFQRVGDKKAFVQVVNDQYRWNVVELWKDQDGRNTFPGTILGTGLELTLQDAKNRVFDVLGVTHG